MFEKLYKQIYFTLLPLNLINVLVLLSMCDIKKNSLVSLFNQILAFYFKIAFSNFSPPTSSPFLLNFVICIEVRSNLFYLFNFFE